MKVERRGQPPKTNRKPRYGVSKKWKPEETAFLFAHYETDGAKWVAERLGRTCEAITRRAYENGLGVDWSSRVREAMPLPPPVVERPAALSEILEYLSGAGIEVADCGNGLFRVGRAGMTAHQLAAMANDHRRRNTKLPILRLGGVDPARYSITGCAAEMTAEE